ncbi:hypothetical protein KI387_039360 [Taxus chinensis]|uniref:Uncharacterized protein n=1 Tax=Taxus chinensis TaxID=29808 RepID=A0AA38C829_TAXCH|nr:hypothetical protein KI387_039360 [Taxus chinensis]
MDSSEAPNQRWWNEDTVAVVTGANKGIGFAIVRQLAEHGIRVILTARDEERGNTAAKNLNQQGFHNVVFHQLDVNDGISVHGFANWMKDNYGKLDILVNNAAISGLAIDYDILKANKSNPTQLFNPPGNKVEGISETYEMAKECIDINYYGTKRMVEAVLPLLKLAGEGGGRIVNVSSRAGVLEPTSFLRLLSMLTLDFLHGEHPHMYVNCVHPGFVNTDLNFNVGKLSIDEGSQGPVMVALLPPGSSSGQYYDETEMASFYVLPKKESP